MANQLIHAIQPHAAEIAIGAAAYAGLAALNLALANWSKLAAFVAARPRLAAVVGILEGVGLDPKKVAQNARDALRRKVKDSGAE